MDLAAALRDVAAEIQAEDVVANTPSHEVRNVVAGTLLALAEKLSPQSESAPPEPEYVPISYTPTPHEDGA